MKIALVIRKFSLSGGAERACVGLGRGLVNRGHAVHVYAQEIARLPGFEPHLVPRDGLFRHLSFAGHMERMLRESNYDIVHSFTRTSRQDVLRLGGGIHKEYLLRTDVAYSALGRFWRRLRPKERFELLLERESFYRGHVVAVSKRVKEEAMRHYGLPDERITVIYNGVDSDEFRPNAEARWKLRREVALDDDAYLVLFCGSGFKRKGLDYAIAAIDRVPGAHLLVVGDGDVPSHPRVRAMGRKADTNHYYAAADALILPTLYDPFPNVCLEAMASGIPVIVSRVAGVSEILDGDSIVVEEPTDIDALAAAVKRLADPAVRTPMGEAARRKAHQFTLQRNLEENLQLYERIIKRREAP